MNRHIIRYYFTEGFRGIFNHSLSSVAAVSVIMACLLIMGSCTLITVNIQALVTQLEQDLPIIAYVDDSVFTDNSLKDAKVRSIGTLINRIDNVRLSKFVDRKEAYSNFFGGQDPILSQNVPLETFPHRYVIYLEDVALANETIALIEKLEGVSDVHSDHEMFETLLSIRGVVQMISLILIVALLVVSLFIMQNTIKLATFERREEIAIMRVVGATKGFVRWPFVVEGFLIGSFAGLVAFLLQSIAYNRFASALLDTFSDLGILSFSELWLPVMGAFVFTGFTVGVFGSLMTIRKYLRA